MRILTAPHARRPTQKPGETPDHPDGRDEKRSPDDEMLEAIIALVQEESGMSKNAAIRALVRMLDRHADHVFEY